MCGFNGIVSVNGTGVNEQLLRAMNAEIVHRGPDDEGLFCSQTNIAFPNSRVGLAFRRLSIIDLESGHQPMGLNHRYWIVFNGEIYNFKELRDNLQKQSRKFQTHSDTEVILHLYELYGEKCLDYLRGMFAFAIWDTEKQELFCARDRIGKKPFYYLQQNNNFYFSSEIKSLLQVPQYKKEINPQVIPQYLAYQFVPGQHTIFKNIFRLDPAHFLKLDVKGNVKKQRYWQISRLPKSTATVQVLKQELRELIEESTRIRMRADVALGAFLSGGIDSGAIVAMMAKHSARAVKTFCVGFEDQEFSEGRFAALTAKKFATQHEEIILKPQMSKILPKLAWHYDQPFADPSALPSYYVAQATRKHVTVALNGDGGDENFGGYLRYRADLAFTKIEKVPLFLRRALSKMAAKVSVNLQKTHLARRLSKAFSLLACDAREFNYSIFCYFNQSAQLQLLQGDLQQYVAQNDPYKLFEDLYEQSDSKELLDQILSCDQNAYLPDCLLIKMDIASMANSLEARSPLLDHKVIEWAARVPNQYKVRAGDNKWIFKQAFKNILPPEILTRRKSGFGIPLSSWLRTEMKDMLQSYLLSDSMRQSEFFNAKEVERLVKEHLSATQDHSYKLWSLLMFELWQEQVFKKNVEK